MPTHTQLFLDQIAAWNGFIIPLVFVIRYTMLQKWWKTIAGQTIFMLDCCLVVVFGLGLLKKYVWTGLPTTFEIWTDVCTILAVGLIVLYRYVALEIANYRRAMDRGLGWRGVLRRTPGSGRSPTDLSTDVTK